MPYDVCDVENFENANHKYKMQKFCELGHPFFGTLHILFIRLATNKILKVFL